MPNSWRLCDLGQTPAILSRAEAALCPEALPRLLFRSLGSTHGLVQKAALTARGHSWRSCGGQDDNEMLGEQSETVRGEEPCDQTTVPVPPMKERPQWGQSVQKAALRTCVV